MNAQYLEQARAAYRAGDFSAASSMFLASKEPGELLGEADHLRGNCLMRLGAHRHMPMRFRTLPMENRAHF